MGFQQEGRCQLWEAVDKQKVLTDSKSLGFSVSYTDKDIIGKAVNYETFYDAARTLGKVVPGTKDKKNDKIENAFFMVVLFIAEGARFGWISHFIGKAFENKKKEEKIESWFKYMVNSWKLLSKLAKAYHKKNPKIKLPIEVDEEDIKVIEQ